MGRNYYTGTDAELATGANAAIAIITPVPATYGVTAAIVTSYTALATDYTTKLGLSTGRSTRTPVAVENKNVARKLLRTASVNLARTIAATPTVTNAMLIGLGMNPRAVPQPRPVPSTPPAMEILSVSRRLVKFRIHDPSSERRGKPIGTACANVFTYVGAAAPTDPTLFQFQGPTTRTTAELQFPNTVASGATIWISACWVSVRGESGPASSPISFALPGGDVLPVAS